jgi:ribosomal-protein-alanine N-acetyltransferase
MRWWDIQPVLALEAELFAEEPWSAGMLWSELAQHESRHYLVAEADGAVIGYAGLAAFGDEAYVQTVGVTAEQQGHGIGTALMHVLVTEAERRGVRTLVLEVRVDNDRAQRLYRSFGFEPVGVRKAYYQPSGTDAVVMIRRTP